MQLWRVEVLATPAWRDLCARCGGAATLDSTGCFRVNSNGARHDVWLLYRCRGCGDTRKRRLAHRVLASELPGGGLDPYLANDAACARRHAFELRPEAPLPYRVLRPALPATGPVAARIALPEPCGERLDRFLARELGCARGAVAHAAATGALQLDWTHSLAGPIREVALARPIREVALARPIRDRQGFTWAR
jgi:hypothetical protein